MLSSQKNRKLLGGLLAAMAVFGAETGLSQSRFDGYEIRVIRPKFMTKRSRTELAGQGTLIMNQSFIYTLMASGILNYHFSESLAIELGGAYGFSIDKDDKQILDDEFEIKTQILRTQYIFNGGLVWTPIYGKTQLPAGDVVYFDSFLTFQAGMTGINYTYEQCAEPPPGRDGLPQRPAAQTISYPTFILGFGQKYFVSKDFGLRWDVRDYIFSYEKGDGTCTPEEPVGSSIHQNITLQWGASKFF
jgi:outer membrane beta-barrel protein